MPLLFIDSKKLQLTFLMSVFTPLFYLLITCNKRGKQNSSRSFEGRTSATARSLSKNTAINDDCCNLVLHSAILNTTSLDTISYQSFSTYVKKQFSHVFTGEETWIWRKVQEKQQKDIAALKWRSWIFEEEHCSGGEGYSRMVQVNAQFKNFTVFPILFWSGFIEDNPDGQMRRDKLLGMYINVLSNAKAKQFVNQIFSKYDTDNSGSIDFKVSSL